MLRDYQKRIIADVREGLVRYRRVILQSPTGSGKTRTVAEIARLANERGRKILIVSNRTEIFSQNGSAFEANGLDVQYISPRVRSVPEGKVCCAMAQTLKRRIERPEWQVWVRTVEMLFIDEAHTCDADFLFEYIAPRCYVVGMTATPSRGGHQKQLGSMYNALVTGISVKELIEQGFLSKAKHYSVAAPKLEGVEYNSTTGDYTGASLAKCFEQHHLYVGLVQEWLRIAEGKKTIVFCVSSNQAIQLTREFNNYGVNAKYLLSGSFDCDDELSGSRLELLESFKNGAFDVLVNVGIAIAGLDIPEIECAVLDYSTVSITKYLQSIGRASRVTDFKKDFIILDCGENYRRFGAYDADREWHLWHYEGNGGGVMTYKLCDPEKKNLEGVYGCGQMVPSPCKVCPCCGRKFATTQDEFQMHLEEISENAEEQSIAKFCADRKLAGWPLSRIMVQVCLANIDNAKAAFVEAYVSLYPEKTEIEAGKYWYVWKRQVWEHVKGRKKIDNLLL